MKLPFIARHLGIYWDNVPVITDFAGNGLLVFAEFAGQVGCPELWVFVITQGAVEGEAKGLTPPGLI